MCGEIGKAKKFPEKRQADLRHDVGNRDVDRLAAQCLDPDRATNKSIQHRNGCGVIQIGSGPREELVLLLLQNYPDLT